jgi:riboflavin synthase
LIFRRIFKSKNITGYIFRFKYPSENQDLIYEQGSIAINGVSLTIAKLLDKTFELEVAIIPHTFEHTTFKNIKMNDLVNLEFDPFAKQIKRHISLLKL